MARYIDADKLKGWLRLDQAGTKNTVTHQSEGLHPIRIMQLKCFIGDIEYCLSKINEAPTADVAEVKHGEWLYRHEHATYSCHSIRIVCNECNHYFARLDGENFKYCPNCGAKMDGQKEGTK